MQNDFLETLALTKEYNSYSKQLETLSFGSIEIRDRNGRKYIYLHKRVSGISRSEYIGEYTDELYKKLEENNQKAKKIKSRLRAISNKLKKQGRLPTQLSDKVKLNVDFAKRNLVESIYKQALLEGVAVTFLDTETIIEGGKVSGISVDDIQKVNNLKHAWQFVLDEAVISSPSDYGLLCYINKLVEEGFYFNAGVLRSVPVSIGGSSYKPPLPIESQVKEELETILSLDDVYDRALKAMLYIARKQLFIDGNKRTSLIFANHILISNEAGIAAVPVEKISEYKSLLIEYYESGEQTKILSFLTEFALNKI